MTLLTLSRRDFLARTSLAVASASLGSSALAANATAVPASTTAPAPGTKTRFELAGFEKHFFEKYTPEELAQTYDEIGLDVELTVRPDGHIKPEQAADQLPLFAEALKKKQRKILVVAASFVRPDEPHLASTLRLAKKLGIEHYRHRGFRYTRNKPIKEQIAEFRSMARDFAAMHADIGIKGLYQNHAGADYVGAAIWDLDQVLDGCDPKFFAVALDTRHLLVEQGMAWPTAARMIAPRVGSLYVKSFKWDGAKPVETPLASGIVTKDVARAIVGSHATLPVCLHLEYPKLQPVPFAERVEIVRLFKADVGVLRGWLDLA